MVAVVCKCPSTNRISANSLAFLIDQETRSGRNFSLDSYPFALNTKDDVNGNGTCDYDSNDSSQIVSGQKNDRSVSPAPMAVGSRSFISDSESGEEKENHDNDTDYFPVKHCSVPYKITLPNSLTELNFDSVFMDAVRYDASYQQVAAIINRTLEVIGAITNEENGLVVNR